MKPFSNESAALQLGELTIENREDRISIFGSLDVTRDRKGLDQASKLKAVVDQIVAALNADSSLPDEVPPADATDEVKNPFL